MVAPFVIYLFNRCVLIMITGLADGNHNCMDNFYLNLAVDRTLSTTFGCNFLVAITGEAIE